MALRGIRRPRVTQVPAGRVVKASMMSAPTALPGGYTVPAGSTVTDATSMLGMLQARTAAAVNGAVPLPRNEGFAALFGPGAPLLPSPFNQPNPRTGQADPRQTEYPVSYNILSNERPIPWSTLRGAADKVDIIRLCLRTRKDELTQMEWGFGFTADAEQQLGITSTAAKREMRDKYSAQFAKLKSFWSVPDKTNDLSWSEWLGMLLEERFVLDALSIYPRLTYGGDLASLEIIDGSTIKPLIDEYGNRPRPPAPAYQQWLYGFPRGEYTDDGASDTWEGTAGSLIYKPYTRRTQSPYGFPEVEQALVSADVYLRRQDWMRQEYTAGSLGRTMLKTDAQVASLTPEQRRAWQVAFNDELAGDTRARLGDFTLLPAGFDPVVSADVAERYKADYDEFLVKLLCAHMATQPSEIGFTPSNGLGGAGFSDAQEDVTYRKSLKPTISWLVDIVNAISAQYLDMPPEITMQFLGMESEDEQAADSVADTRVKGGRMTLNEDRDRTGQPRYTFAEADMPMLMTARGVVFLEGASETEPAGVEVGPAQAPPAGPAMGAAGGGSSPDNAPTDGGAPPDSGEDTANEDETTAAKAELVAFRRFLGKRGKLTREFTFTELGANGDVLNEVAKVDAEWAAELAGDLAKGFDPGESRDFHGRWGGGGGAKPAGQTYGDSKGHTIEITAKHKKDVKAAKLSTQQQMEYSARRFKGESHEDALAHAKASPRKADGGVGGLFKAGGAGGRDRAPEGARPDHRQEHAGYPLHVAGVGP